MYFGWLGTQCQQIQLSQSYLPQIQKYAEDTCVQFRTIFNTLYLMYRSFLKSSNRESLFLSMHLMYRSLLKSWNIESLFLSMLYIPNVYNFLEILVFINAIHTCCTEVSWNPGTASPCFYQWSPGLGRSPDQRSVWCGNLGHAPKFYPMGSAINRNKQMIGREKWPFLILIAHEKYKIHESCYIGNRKEWDIG